MGKPPYRRRPRQQDDTTAGLPARRAALRLLDAVTRRGEPLEIAFHAATQGLPDRADRALAHAIAAEVLRWAVPLDRLIDGATERPLPEDAKARMVLRLALAQLLVLGTPDHAAVATALPLVDGGPRRLVHGVLGSLIRSGANLPALPELPPETEARWREQWGEEMVLAARRAWAMRAPIDLTLADPGRTVEWTERLGGVSLLPGHVRLPADSAVTALPGFGEGAWWVQDLAASLPARLAGAGQGRSAIDLCAAPGGKAMQLAAAGWRVTAVDKSAKRLGRMEENLARTGLTATVIAADALQWRPDTPADLVLLDAPCSATGIFRRHPDVLHRVGERQIAEMAALQAEMLDHAASMVAPGGLLIYATCSLERAEGEDQVAAFLQGNLVFRPETGAIPPIFPGTEAGGCLRTLPSMLEDAGRLDGFCIAALRRA